MTVLKEIEDRYPEITRFIERLVEDGYQVRSGKDSLQILGESVSLILKDSDLRNLNNGKQASSHAVIYHDDWGISAGLYSEIFIRLGHPQYLTLEDWPSDKQLEFRIGKVLVSVGDVSPLLCLLTEPVFGNGDYYPDGFSRLTSLRLVGVSAQSVKSIFHKAMFYLNYHYLRPLGMHANLSKLLVSFDDPLGLMDGEGDYTASFEQIVRRRIRTRLDLQSQEPLMLYNHAAQSTGADAFLNFYRILEFFTHRNTISTLEKTRYDSRVSTNALFNICAPRNEQQALMTLITRVLTSP